MARAHSIAPMVSCIMPVHNAAAYVQQAVASVQQQDFSDFELIVVCDGCTDSSASKVQRLAQQDGRIRLVSQVRSRVAGALNRGLQLARGQYIARMDADDVALPHRFSRQLAILAQNPDAVAVGSRMDIIDKRGNMLKKGVSEPSGVSIRAFDLTVFPPVVGALNHPTLMVRAEGLRRIGGYDPSMKYAEDYDLWLRLHKQGRLLQMYEVLLLYRSHGRNASFMHFVEQEEDVVIAEMRAVAQAWQKSGRTLKISAAMRQAYLQMRIAARRQIRPGPRMFAKIVAGALGTDWKITARLLQMAFVRLAVPSPD